MKEEDPQKVSQNFQELERFYQNGSLSIQTVEDCIELASIFRVRNDCSMAADLFGQIDKRFFAADLLPILLDLMHQAFSTGHFEACKRLATVIKQSYPQNCHAYRMLAKILWRENELEAAEQMLLQCPLRDSNLDVNLSTVYSALEIKIFRNIKRLDVTFRRPLEQPALERAFVLTMIRDEDDIISAFLDHHYALGFRRFAVIMNCCVDRTADLVAAFKDKHEDIVILVILDEVAAYYQAEKTQAAYEYAVAYFKSIQMPMTWCFLLDADEFIATDEHSSVQKLISGAERDNASVIVMHLCNATNEEGRNFETTSNLYKFFDVIEGGSHHTVTKNAFRTDLRPRIRMGNHQLAFDGIDFEKFYVGADTGFYLIHLPYRSVEHVRKKIVNGGKALRQTNLGEHLGGHWRRMYEEYLEKGEPFIQSQFSNYVERTKRNCSIPSSMRFPY